ncbi:hypothetical protein [Actinoplanes sp. DH11]|uniref:hypothetical protein n=1 Tax=Actinoplanes sp. DH11 TaxID=2857011 RepID=UPI001E393E04|nr:hypothetical protein [Actinoplanes sp. DH11]
MSRRTRTRQRAVAAYGVLRGRPPRPDYGVLVVLPLVAAAGGALIGLSLENAVQRRGHTPGGIDG